jgi:anhydro-N-acetylmuramic acid kinase
MRIAGLMSGTSLDGIDVAIVDIHGKKIACKAFHHIPYPKAVREALLSVSNNITHTATISRLNFLLGALYADAIHEAARRHRVPLKSIDLVGMHGQTSSTKDVPSNTWASASRALSKSGKPPS